MAAILDSFPVKEKRASVKVKVKVDVKDTLDTDLLRGKFFKWSGIGTGYMQM